MTENMLVFSHEFGSPHGYTSLERLVLGDEEDGRWGKDTWDVKWENNWGRQGGTGAGRWESRGTKMLGLKCYSGLQHTVC